jgi:hypothetical protein
LFFFFATWIKNMISTCFQTIFVKKSKSWIVFFFKMNIPFFQSE